MVITCLLALLFFFGWQQFFKQPSSANHPINATRPDATARSNELSQNTDSDSDEETSAVDRETYIKKRFQDGYEEGVKRNVPIRFYGKVIDQNDAGIPSVKVKAEVVGFNEAVTIFSKYGEDQKRISVELATDDKGLFSITQAKGYSLLIKSLEKEGYESQARFGLVKDFQYSGNLAGIKLHSPDPNHPTVFKMWKRKGSEPLFYRRTGESIPCDGTPIRFDLKKGREVKTGGDIQVSLIRTPLHINRGREKYDWVANIDMLGGGGFVQSNDDFMNEAPESGYSPSMTIEMQKKDPDWKSQVSVSLYFKTGDGRYGRVKLEFATDFEPPPTGFGMEIYLNPSGSRNLEYDVDKKINSQ